MEKSDLPTGRNATTSFYKQNETQLKQALDNTEKWAYRAIYSIPLSFLFAGAVSAVTALVTGSPEASMKAGIFSGLIALPLTTGTSMYLSLFNDNAAKTLQSQLNEAALANARAANERRREITSAPVEAVPPQRPMTVAERTVARVQARHERRADAEVTKTPERDASSDMFTQNMVVAAVVTTAIQNESAPALTCAPQTDSGSSTSQSTYTAPVSDYGSSSSSGFDGGGVCAPQMM